MASQSSSELELPDCPSQPTGITFLRGPSGKRRLFTALFRAVGSNCGNGYTMTLFQNINKYYFLSIIRGVVHTDGCGLFGCTGSNLLPTGLFLKNLSLIMKEASIKCLFFPSAKM